MPTTTAWKSPSSAISQSIGWSPQVNWTFSTSGGDSTGVSAENDAGASITLLYALPTSCQHILARGFDFSSVPDGAEIVGVEVRVRRKAETASTIKDYELKLIEGPTPTLLGSNKADTTNWHPTAYAYASYGGASDVWGATLTAAGVKDSNFGVGVKFQCSSLPSSAKGAWVDVIEMRITYIENGGPLESISAISTTETFTESVSVLVPVAQTSASATSETASPKVRVDVPQESAGESVTSEEANSAVRMLVPFSETSSSATGGNDSARTRVNVPLSSTSSLATDGSADPTVGVKVSLSSTSTTVTSSEDAGKVEVFVSLSFTDGMVTSESFAMSSGSLSRRRVTLFT